MVGKSGMHPGGHLETERLISIFWMLTSQTLGKKQTWETCWQDMGSLEKCAISHFYVKEKL